MAVPTITTLVTATTASAAVVEANDQAIRTQFTTGNLDGTNITTTDAEWEVSVDSGSTALTAATGAYILDQVLTWKQKFAATVTSLHLIGDGTLSAANRFDVMLQKTTNRAGAWTDMIAAVVAVTSDEGDVLEVTFSPATLAINDFVRIKVTPQAAVSARLWCTVRGYAGHIG